jgi:hypothetical protein
VGQGVAEAERERELSKQALAAHVSALESRVREELDWRARLRRDGARYAVIGTVAVALAVSVLVLRSRGRRKEAPPVAVTSLDDVATQLEEIRKELGRRRKENGPLWQRVALRAATTAAAAGGTAVARRAMERMGDAEPAAAAPAGREPRR